MEIYIDESGLFVDSNKSDSWSAVAAFAVPDKAVSLLELMLCAAKASIGCDIHAEIKLKDFHANEIAYIRFLDNIALLDGLVFAAASDSSVNDPDRVRQHQRTQVSKILENVDKMRHEGGRRSVEITASQLEKLSPQLYIQLYCQIELLFNVFSHSLNYFSQRCPETLGRFMWRIDRSGTPPSAFEDAFERMSPLLLQTMSISDPWKKIASPDFDYSYLGKFEMPVPEFLKNDYGISVGSNRSLDIQKIIHGDMKFVDSAEWAGVQVVDLIVSGLRRCLQHGFIDNDRAATSLGRLMVRAPFNGVPIQLLGFRADRALIGKKTERSVNIMRANAKPMIRKLNRRDDES